jgi:uncharacterized protein YjbI with pentapeptide repeats
MGYILGEPTVQQYFDANGDPLENGTIEFFIYNTSTPTPIYSNSTGTSAGTSVTLNSIGAPKNGGTSIALFFDESVVYKIVRKDSAGSAIAPTIGPYYPNGGSPITIDAVASTATDSLYDYTGTSNGDQASVAGYYVPGDGGGGVFYWNSTSTAADDGGMTILPTGHVGAGRWKRIYNAQINVKFFGAVGDEVADDLIPLQTAVDFGGTGGEEVYLPKGNYLVTGTIIVPQHTTISGNGVTVSKIVTATDAPIIQLGAVDAFFTRGIIRNLGLKGDGSGTKTNQHGIFANVSGGGYITQCIFENINMFDMSGNGFRIDGGNGSGLINCTFNSMKIQDNSADCVRLSGFCSAISFNQCSFVTSDFSGVGFSGAYQIQAVTFNNCQFEGLHRTGTSVGYGLFIPKPTSGLGAQVTLNNCYFEGIALESTAPTEGSAIYAISPAELKINGGLFASSPHGIRVSGNNSNVIIDGPQFAATDNVTSATLSFMLFENSDKTSRLNIRNIALYYNISTGGFTSSNYLQFNSWLGDKQWVIDSDNNTLLVLDNFAQTALNDTSIATTTEFDTGVALNYGVIRVYDRSEGAGASIMITGTSRVIMGETIAGRFSTTKGNANTVNVYVQTGTIWIENQRAIDPMLVFWTLQEDRNSAYPLA